MGRCAAQGGTTFCRIDSSSQVLGAGEKLMKKILVVDDSSTVRQQVGLALTQAGYTIVEAGDGVEGLAMLEKGGISLVICDVNMPRMNGLDMLENVKRDTKHAALPVVMLTTEGQPALVDRAKKAGAKGWIVKPFKAEMMIAAIGKLVGGP
jgi:two-component system chemotaxis response regulator CheY